MRLKKKTKVVLLCDRIIVELCIKHVLNIHRFNYNNFVLKILSVLNWIISYP